MRGGKLDRYALIERISSRSQDDTGAVIENWSVRYPRVPVQVVEASAEEFIRAYGASEDHVVLFRCRFISDIELSDRLTFEGMVYSIVSIRPLGRRRDMELRAVAQASG